MAQPDSNGITTASTCFDDFMSSKLHMLSSSYSTFQDWCSLRADLPSKLARLDTVRQEREWRALILRQTEEEQTLALYHVCAKEVDEEYQKSVNECKERMMAELLEERTRLMDLLDMKGEGNGNNAFGVAKKSVIGESKGSSNSVTVTSSGRRVLRNQYNISTNNNTDTDNDETGAGGGMSGTDLPSFYYNPTANGSVTSRPKRHQQAPPANTIYSTLGNASLTTTLNDQDLNEDLAVLFPEIRKKPVNALPNSGGNSTSTSSTTLTKHEVKVDSGQLVYQGTRFVKGEKVRVSSQDGTKTIFVGVLSVVSFADIVIKVQEGESDGTIVGSGVNRFRVPHSQLRSGKYQLSHV